MSEILRSGLLQHLNRCSVKESGALSSALERELLFTARADTGSVVLGGRDADLVPARGTESMFRPFPVVIIEDILRHDFTVDELSLIHICVHSKSKTIIVLLRNCVCKFYISFVV